MRRAMLLVVLMAGCEAAKALPPTRSRLAEGAQVLAYSTAGAWTSARPQSAVLQDRKGVELIRTGTVMLVLRESPGESLDRRVLVSVLDGEHKGETFEMQRGSMVPR